MRHSGSRFGGTSTVQFIMLDENATSTVFRTLQSAIHRREMEVSTERRVTLQSIEPGSDGLALIKESVSSDSILKGPFVLVLDGADFPYAELSGLLFGVHVGKERKVFSTEGTAAWLVNRLDQEVFEQIFLLALENELEVLIGSLTDNRLINRKCANLFFFEIECVSSRLDALFAIHAKPR